MAIEDMNVSSAGEESGTPAGEKKPVTDFRTFGANGEEAETQTDTVTHKSDEPKEPNDDGHDDDGDEGSGDTGKKPRRGGFQKKIAKLEAELAELKAGKPAQETKPAEATDTKAERPKLDAFTNYDDYVEALTDWKADQATDRKLQERDNRSKEAQERDAFAAKVSAYDKQAEIAREKYGDDFDEALVSVPNPTRQVAIALIDSDIGAEVAYYLASNPDLYEKINNPNMSPLQLAKEIGRIEATLDVKAKPDEQTVAKEKPKLPSAPAPITPVGGSKKSGTFDRENASYEEYSEWRRKQG